METIILYTNTEAVEYELECLDKAKTAIEERVQLLTKKGIEPTISNIKLINLGDVFDTKKNMLIEKTCEKFKHEESEKIRNIIKQFGETALTDGWEQKVSAKVEVFKKELLTSIPDWYFENDYYIDYFEIIDLRVKLKSFVNREFFVNKNSVVICEEEVIEKFEIHKQICQQLNKLINHPDNEFEALSKLFWFNTESKEFELNIETYDPGFSKFKFMEKRNSEIEIDKKNKAYNESMKPQGTHIKHLHEAGYSNNSTSGEPFIKRR